jgi:tetratricopeptide (TPR) repeat protein
VLVLDRSPARQACRGIRHHGGRDGGPDDNGGSGEEMNGVRRIKLRISPFQRLAAVAIALAMTGCGDQRDAVAYTDRGNARLAVDDFDGAIANYSQALALSPTDGLVKLKLVFAYDRRGEAMQSLGKFDGAITDFTHHIELLPKLVTGYNHRAAAKQAKGDLDGAIADWSKAIEMDPKDPAGYLSRANSRNVKRDLDGAIADWSKAIEIDPKDAAAYLSRASAKLANGDLDGYIADHTSALGLDPNSLNIYARSYYLYDTQKFAEALGDFRYCVEFGPMNEPGFIIFTEYSMFRVWLIRARQGDEKGATQELLAYLAVRRIGPDWNLSIIRYLVGQLSESDFFSAAKSNYPKTESEQMCEAYFYSGSKHQIAGETQVAIDMFKKCVAVNRKDIPVYFFQFAIDAIYISALAELKVLDTPKK